METAMSQTNAQRLAGIEVEQRYTREALQRGDKKFDRIEEGMSELLDRSRNRDGEWKEMQAEQSRQLRALNDQIESVRRDVAAMTPHVALIAQARAGARLTRRVVAWVGGTGAGGLLAAWLAERWDIFAALWRR